MQEGVCRKRCKPAKPGKGAPREAEKAAFKPRPDRRPESAPCAARSAEAPADAARTTAEPQRALIVRTGERPAERVPLILESQGAGDFHLIDSGEGEKLEQYGPYRIVRPEAQAL